MRQAGRLLILICFLLFSNLAQCQKLFFRTGLSLNLGTPINSIGWMAGASFTQDFIQLNGDLRVNYFLRSWPGPKGWEFQAIPGINLGFGNERKQVDSIPRMDLNLTERQYSIGYNYILYVDSYRSSQKSGAFGFHAGKLGMYIENDVFAGQGKDSYRTGGFKIVWQERNIEYAVSAILWTGDATSPLSRRINDSSYPSRFGYKDLSVAPYGQISHGVLCLQAQSTLPYYQSVRARIGIDAEQVRNAIQNKLIHDMYFWPRRWNKATNPHYPMLDVEGLPYLHGKNQVIKKPLPFIDIGLNPGVFY